ncbi:unnamed protein product [Heligmosomoides polygyrus]|uniref:SnoaL-like domain-containing protein n=1 Tax=Heligmosomoides polygyrus TaxID=6339 RepID=A0A183F9K4_HELPZ|nr:unnamed protein product [Heligmosomoides polygyrus]
MEECYSSGNVDKLIEFYHPDSVLLEGRNTYSGAAGIKEVYKKYFDLYGPMKFEVSDEKYQGCEDYLMFNCKCSMASRGENIEKVKVISIWRKIDDKWLIYHEEYTEDQ